MTFIINQKIINNTYFIEAGQRNPLRWTFLKKEDDGSFSKLHNELKCKDYFNDVVAAYKGVFFSVYGFSNKDHAILYDEGQYLLLKYIAIPEVFSNNLEVINKELEDSNLPKITFDIQGTECLLFIPREFFESSYYISLLTYLIRISNSSFKCSSVDQLMSNENIGGYYFQVDEIIDCPFKTTLDTIKKNLFKIKNLPPFCLKMKRGDNSFYTQQTLINVGSHTLHNNGVGTWASLEGVF